MMQTSQVSHGEAATNGWTRLLTIVAIVLLAFSAEFILTGCSSTPKAPTEALQAAELAITTAEQARVPDYASPELGEAREKLVAARLAVENKEMLRAERLAQQSKAAADLATARFAAAKAKAVNDELQKGNSVLKQELQRNTGGQ